MADSTATPGISWQNVTGITSLGTVTVGVWNASTIAVLYGGTGATTALGGFNNLSPLTTKGDLLADDGTNNVRVSVGTNGQLLTADSTASSGVSWQSTTSITTLGTVTTGVWNASTIAIVHGGTGATTALGAFNNLSPLTTKGDILADDGTNNVRVAVGTNGQFLMADSSAGSGVSWQTVGSGITTLGTVTVGVWNASTIAIAYGGTGATTALGGFNNLSPLTTKGDLLADDGTNNVRVPVGANNQILVADNTASSGVAWKTTTTITTLGTITTGTWNATTIAINHGGTGATTALGGFNALSPLTTKGDTTHRRWHK